MPARALDLDALESTRLRTEPFNWSLVDPAFRPGVADLLLDTFPAENYWIIDGNDGEKQYTYLARPLVTLGASTPVEAPDLDPIWTSFAEDLVSEDYRHALSALAGVPLHDALMEASIWRWDSGHQLGPHRDMASKLVTQVFYFSERWEQGWGGTLQILRSQNPDDVYDEIPPVNGTSSVLVRSETSWHAVSEIGAAAPEPRRSVIVTWFVAGSTSPVWGVDEDGTVFCTAGGVREPQRA